MTLGDGRGHGAMIPLLSQYHPRWFYLIFNNIGCYFKAWFSCSNCYWTLSNPSRRFWGFSIIILTYSQINTSTQSILIDGISQRLTTCSLPLITVIDVILSYGVPAHRLTAFSVTQASLHMIFVLEGPLSECLEEECLNNGLSISSKYVVNLASLDNSFLVVL